MSVQLLGELMGRLVASYLLVFLVFYVFSGFRLRKAAGRSLSWYGIGTSVLLFVVVYGASLVRDGAFA